MLARSTVPSALQVEAVELAGAADVVVVVVGDVEEAIVRRDQHAVGPLQLPADDARHLAVGVDAIDALDDLALVIDDVLAGRPP